MSAKITGRDPVAQIKEQYALRERETDNRHREDIREIQGTHREELEKVREESQKRIQTLQDESANKLNMKDLQHQKEIEALRAMYAKKLAEAKKPE